MLEDRLCIGIEIILSPTLLDNSCLFAVSSLFFDSLTLANMSCGGGSCGRDLTKKLTSEQYHVTQEAGTEEVSS